MATFKVFLGAHVTAQSSSAAGAVVAASPSLFRFLIVR